MKTSEWERRVGKLESKGPPGMAAEAEEHFWAIVHATRDCFDDEQAGMDEAERVARLSPLQHVAWNLRFTGDADFEATLAHYGLGRTSNEPASEIGRWSGWVLLISWIPGD